MSEQEATEKVDNKKIYVGNLASCVKEEDLKQLFGLETTPYLRQSCKCDLRTKGDKSQGFAFITVPAHLAGELLNLNGIEFWGQELVIEESKTDDAAKKTSSNNKGGNNRGRNGNKGGQRNDRFRRNYNRYAMPKLDDDQKWDIIDGGANLTSPKFHQNKETVVRRAQEAGVSKIVVTGLKLNGSITAETMSAASGYTNLYAAVGVHPHFVKDDWSDKACEKIAEMAKKKHVVAVGEVGLDYCRNYSDKEAMKSAFKAQVKIAADENKTLLVHDREAFDDVMAILGEFTLKAPVVIYCMTGPTEQIKSYLNRGYYIGITGYICKDYGKHIRDAIKDGDIPLSKIIVHSNAPYMIPNMPPTEIDPVSKSLIDLCSREANEPCTLQVVVRQIATLLSKAPGDVAQQLLKNAQNVYRFPESK